MPERNNRRFRNKDFLSFLREQELSAGFWVMFIFCVFLAAGVVALDFSQGRFPYGAIFILLVPVGIIVFFSGYAFSIYKKGEAIFNSEAYGSALVVENVRVYVKGFDPFRRRDDLVSQFKEIFNLNFDYIGLNYDFDEADLLLNDDALMLLGKSNFLFGKTYAAPVELVLNKNWSFLNQAKIESIQELADGRPEVRINDPHCKDEIKIVMESRDEIKKWVSEVKQHLLSRS